MGNERKIEAASYEGNQSTYLGTEIEKVSDSDCECVIWDADNYEDKINYIEISHERAKRRNEALTEADQTIPRSELGKIDVGWKDCATGRDLRRIGRRANFLRGEVIDSIVGNADFP